VQDIHTERERETDRQTDRQTDGQRNRDRERTTFALPRVRATGESGPLYRSEAERQIIVPKRKKEKKTIDQHPGVTGDNTIEGREIPYSSSSE